MRSRYIVTSCSDVISRERKASWSCGTVASTSCSEDGTPKGGWAASDGTSRISVTRATAARFMEVLLARGTKTVSGVEGSPRFPDVSKKLSNNRTEVSADRAEAMVRRYCEP